MWTLKTPACVVLLAVVVALASPQGNDGFTDENRPYEFGFNIEGHQHRHEKKDEKGIIMGEFGFITADGIYHVTVYATDENGDFKILSMKNIKVGFPPGNPTTQPPPPPRVGAPYSPPSATIATTTTQRPVVPGCGGCKVPIPTAAPVLRPPGTSLQAPEQGGPSGVSIPSSGGVTPRPPTVPQGPPAPTFGAAPPFQPFGTFGNNNRPGAFGNPATPVGQQPTTGVFGNPPISGGKPPATGVFLRPQFPGGPGNVQPSSLQNPFGNPTTSGVQSPASGTFGKPAAPAGFGNTPQTPTQRPIIGAFGKPQPSGGQTPSSGFGKPALPGFSNVPVRGQPASGGLGSPAPGNIGGLVPSVFGGQAPAMVRPGSPGSSASPTLFGSVKPGGGSPLSVFGGQKPATGNPGNQLSPGVFGSARPEGGSPPSVFGGGTGGTSPVSPGSGNRPATGTFGGISPPPSVSGSPGIPAGSPALGTRPFSPSGPPGQRPTSTSVPIGAVNDGLPQGVTMQDIKDLLYRFNYTVGFHGHHESGYKNGAKIGDYFVNSRDGIGRRVEYLANEFGYQPNITLVDLQALDTPREETEKEFGLKGYEFKWFYRR